MPVFLGTNIRNVHIGNGSFVTTYKGRSLTIGIILPGSASKIRHLSMGGRKMHLHTHTGNKRNILSCGDSWIIDLNHAIAHNGIKGLPGRVQGIQGITDFNLNGIARTTDFYASCKRQLIGGCFPVSCHPRHAPTVIVVGCPAPKGGPWSKAIQNQLFTPDLVGAYYAGFAIDIQRKVLSAYNNGSPFAVVDPSGTGIIHGFGTLIQRQFQLSGSQFPALW